MDSHPIPRLCAEVLWHATKDPEQLESILHDLENISCDLRAVLSAPEADGQFACRSTEYDYKLGPAYKKISEKWPGIRMYELCAIASAIVRKVARPELKLSREARRKKSLLFQWFDDNWHHASPIIDKVVFVLPSDDEGEEEADESAAPTKSPVEACKPEVSAINTAAPEMQK